MSRADKARLVAFDVIHSVHKDDAYSNLILPSAIDRAGLVGRDAGFATELTYGTLRRQVSLDAVINACAARDDLDLAVRDVLRLGIYQLLFMRVPSHAAVSATVDVARDVLTFGPAKFVNAVLRKASTHTWEEWLEELTAELPLVEKLSIEYAYPVWVIRALAESYRLTPETVVDVLAAGNEPASVSLVAKPGQSDVNDLLQIEDVSPGMWSPFAATLARGKPGDIPEIRDHSAGVQDEGSQLIALALAQVDVAGDETRWLDMCAGPGGKAAILAGLSGERGIDFVAIEPTPVRADLVRKSIAGAPGLHEVITSDARDFEATDEADKFDRILIDAPCSGLGALRRRPEARWRKQPNDVPTLAKLQTSLLAHGATLVKVGGVIGYATCSPHLAETDAIVGAFLRTHPQFEQVKLASALPMLNLEPEATSLRLRPDLHQTDGMYLAILRRTS